MKKIIIAIAFFLLFASYPVYAEQNYNFDFISETQIQLSNKNIQVSGNLPNINVKKFKNKDFANLLNQKINSIYKKKLEEAISQKAKSLKIDYQVKARKNVVSLVIYFSGNKKDAETINFNLQICNFVTMVDILGPNAIAIVNKIIKDDTIKSAQKYNSNFIEIDNTHNFYVDSDNLVVIFNEYDLSPAIKGIQKFNINIGSVINKSIDKNDYYITKPYNLKMIPIREICEAFDYKLLWNKTSYSIQITKNDLDLSALINRNSYSKSKKAPQTLESAAQLKDGKTYAPISFFSEYMDLIYSIDENNTITFSQYN